MLFVGLWLICGLIAGYIYTNRGRSGLVGFLGGVIFGPIGLILALLTTPDKTAMEEKRINEEVERIGGANLKNARIVPKLLKQTRRFASIVAKMFRRLCHNLLSVLVAE